LVVHHQRLAKEDGMRLSSAFSRLLRLEGVWVRGVRFEPDRVIVRVALRRRRLVCPECSFSTPHRHNVREAQSVWRHLDLGVWRLEIRAQLRRLSCPVHGVRTEGVPFARAGSDFTRDFERLVAYLATRTDKSTICRLVRINWRTVGRIIERVTKDELDPDRLEDLFDIGIDEVSWRKQHRYLTLVCDHQRRRVVWGVEGAGEKAADTFFEELGAERSAKVRAISLDMGPGYAKSARKHAPQARICIDSYHVVALATKALDEVRRDYWNELRALGDQRAARRFKDARWALLKNPENLTEAQAATYRKLKRAGGAVWLAYTLKEALRAIFTPGLDLDDPQPPSPVRPTRPDDRKAPRGHPRRGSPGHHPGPHRGTQQQGPAHHPARLRVSLRQSRARPGAPHLRPHQSHTPTRVSPTSMTREPLSPAFCPETWLLCAPAAWVQHA
jgi:transposase